MPWGTQTNRELLRVHGVHGELWTCSANGELVRACNVSVNHSADACDELSMACDVSHEDLAMRGELLVAHDSGGEPHGELYMACDARDITQREPIGSAGHCHPEKDDTMRGELPP